MVGSDVLYSSINGECEHGPQELFASLNSYSLGTRTTHRRSPSGRGVLVALARDHGTTYWIRDVLRPEDNCQPGHDPTVAPCGAPAEEARCQPGFAACGAEVFYRHRDCNPDQGTCTLMETTDLEPR